jgi:hypothetical protein
VDLIDIIPDELSSRVDFDFDMAQVLVSNTSHHAPHLVDWIPGGRIQRRARKCGAFYSVASHLLRTFFRDVHHAEQEQFFET